MNPSRTVVLVGAGHVNLYVAARSSAFTERGVRVVLVDPDRFWYSGLATGMLGGRYDAVEDQVDPRPVVEAGGGTFIRDRVAAITPDARRVRLAGGGELSYDYLSLNLGSRVDASRIEGAGDDPTVWSVKPISSLARLREHLQEAFRAGAKLRVTVVGGGATGSEVAANLAALASRHRAALSITLATPGDGVMKYAPGGAARFVAGKLEQLGVRIRTERRIRRRERGRLVAEDGSRLEADLVVLATGLEAHPLVYELGLPTRSKHGLRITSQLHSIADPRIFAGGDCAALEGHELPKLGVFGVRQAACIHGNLLASLDGHPLSHYVPQKRYLAILNLGDGTAVSTWGRWWSHGRSSLWLKEHLDRRFLNRYRRTAAAR
jgi:NADH dehydrogenase FAD-containing subunit